MTVIPIRGDNEKLTQALAKLNEHAQGLRIELESLRMHFGSASHFLEMAVGDLQKAIDKLRESLEAQK